MPRKQPRHKKLSSPRRDLENRPGVNSKAMDHGEITLPAKRPASPNSSSPEADDLTGSPALPASMASVKHDEAATQSGKSNQGSPPVLCPEGESHNEEAYKIIAAEKLARWGEFRRFNSGYDLDTVCPTAQKLEYYSTNLIWECFPVKLHWDTIRDCDKDHLNTWAPNARHWLDSETTMDTVALLSAWIWRIIWEQQFSPNAPVDKWKSPIWADFGNIKTTIAADIGDPRSTQSIWYKSSTHAMARLIYMQNGDHSDPSRLARKLREPFKHILQLQGKEKEEKLEEYFQEISKRAVLIDFQQEFALFPIECLWQDPYTQRTHSFPLKNYESARAFMATDFH